MPTPENTLGFGRNVSRSSLFFVVSPLADSLPSENLSFCPLPSFGYMDSHESGKIPGLVPENVGTAVVGSLIEDVTLPDGTNTLAEPLEGLKINRLALSAKWRGPLQTVYLVIDDPGSRLQAERLAFRRARRLSVMSEPLALIEPRIEICNVDGSSISDRSIESLNDSMPDSVSFDPAGIVNIR